MTGTNNLSLDNLRLTNTLLENKIKEGPEINTRLNDLNTKLLLNETNTNALNNQLKEMDFDKQTTAFENPRPESVLDNCNGPKGPWGNQTAAGPRADLFEP